MRTQLQIALLHYSCPPVVGGVEEVVRQQASLFQRHFHPVKVLAGAGGPFGEVPVEIYPLFGSRHEAVAAAQRIGAEQPDRIHELADEIYAHLAPLGEAFNVLIAHNVLTMHYNLPLALALHRLADSGVLKVVSWNHDSPFFYDDLAEQLSHPVWNVLRTRNPNIRYVVISASRWRQFGELYGGGQPLDVIPNGIDPVRFFRLDPSTVRVIQEQNLFEAEFLMVQPCRLHPRKNIELSIRVLRALRDRGVDARLLLTGAYDPHEDGTVRYARRLGDLARELGVGRDILLLAEYRFASGERLGADRVTIRDLYLLADVLFLPSRQEGFGIPLLEAGMIKLPILCSDIEPFREIGGDHVWTFSLDDPPERIAGRLIEQVRALPPQRMFRHVIREYVWDNLYRRRLLPLLSGLVEGRGG